MIDPIVIDQLSKLMRFERWQPKTDANCTYDKREPEAELEITVEGSRRKVRFGRPKFAMMQQDD